MAATRLPNKPMADIAGKPLVVHVWERGMEADLGPVVVACDDQKIVDAVQDCGGQAVFTDSALPSGTDRVYQGLERFDPDGKYDTVINLQGDLPIVDPECLHGATKALENPLVDIGTIATLISDENDLNNPNAAKACLAHGNNNQPRRAIYFSRSKIPHGNGPHFHHQGLYAFKRKALKRFVSLSPSPLELSESLEQLRAIENGMRIDVTIVNSKPVEVNSPEDLEKVRKYFLNLK